MFAAVSTARPNTALPRRRDGNSLQLINMSSSLIAACGILVLCIAGGYGEISRQALLQELGIELFDDTQSTSTLEGVDVNAATHSLRAVCYLFFLIGVVDVIVSLALYDWLKHDALAAVSSCLRMSYAIIELAASTQLIIALVPLHKLDATGVNNAMLAFDVGFNMVALPVFGVHLVVLGLAVARTLGGGGHSTARSVGCSGMCSSAPVVYGLSVLIVIAGVGYVVDGWGMVHHLPEKSPIQLSASGTAVGEVLLMVWLFARHACSGNTPPAAGQSALSLS